jgi:hypothetical protein
VSDRIRARLVVAGTSTFLSVFVAAVLLVGLGALAGRLAVPTLPGASESQVSLPVLSDTVPIPESGPGAIPGGGFPDGPGPGGPGGPGTGTPPEIPEDEPAVGLTAEGDVGNLGLIGVDVPVGIGSSSGETTNTELEVLGVKVTLQTSDDLLTDVVCLVVCPAE